MASLAEGAVEEVWVVSSMEVLLVGVVEERPDDGEAEVAEEEPLVVFHLSVYRPCYVSPLLCFQQLSVTKIVPNTFLEIFFASLLVFYRLAFRHSFSVDYS